MNVAAAALEAGAARAPASRRWRCRSPIVAAARAGVRRGQWPPAAGRRAAHPLNRPPPPSPARCRDATQSLHPAHRSPAPPHFLATISRADRAAPRARSARLRWSMRCSRPPRPAHAPPTVPCLKVGTTNVLAAGAEEEKGETARLASFVGALAITDLVKTTLGPKGCDARWRREACDFGTCGHAGTMTGWLRSPARARRLRPRAALAARMLTCARSPPAHAHLPMPPSPFTFPNAAAGRFARASRIARVLPRPVGWTRFCSP